ncbi:hypothetical protein FPCIR_10491 [Fusarium pseudocircinatum]|uniref:Uncharacterized protein n=1 Tax=Fusarium pseudocircinatum TaxID=56676 RepID=A0A8H5KWM5_9HYPO|nr:hypothetical protein FPCIR_10491 [Fusarium pseudocircinatum]
MQFTSTLVAYLAYISMASAVTIRNFRAGTCKGSNYAECKGIKTYDCCDKTPTKSVYSSSRFLGLPTTGIGAIYNEEKGKNCGRVHAAGSGLNACVGKSNSRGSFWFDCRQTGTCNQRNKAAVINNSRLANIQATGSVAPDIVAIDYHRFYTNESTPDDVVHALLNLFETDISYEDIPIELKKYEEVKISE